MDLLYVVKTWRADLAGFDGTIYAIYLSEVRAYLYFNTNADDKLTEIGYLVGHSERMNC